jgi:pimeloyl-ACP methyl ester carboxylesterase
MLADAIEQALRDHPEAVVDVYAHSMGGVVARLALVDLARRGVDLHRLGLVTTLGSPHHGADLATALAAARTTVTGSAGLDLAEAWLGTGLDPDATAVAQLAETSSVVRMLDEVGVPPDVDLLSIAASGDLIVASPNSQVDGERNVTVSLGGAGAHGELVGADETTDEIARALVGEPPGCRPVAEMVDQRLVGHGISYMEDVVGFAALNSTR